MDKNPALEAKLVEEFIVVSHGNLERVKELVAQEPSLVNATWDWGEGDFETALGGASHKGNIEIANYLLNHGARLDIFAATMLGKLDIVKATLIAFPNTKNVPGPHGIPLIAHAAAGGEQAKKVLEFLQSL